MYILHILNNRKHKYARSYIKAGFQGVPVATTSFGVPVANQQARQDRIYGPGFFVSVTLWKVACQCGSPIERLDDPYDDRCLEAHVAVCPASATNQLSQAAAVRAQGLVVTTRDQARVRQAAKHIAAKDVAHTQ